MKRQINVNVLKPGFTTTLRSKCLILAPPCKFGANNYGKAGVSMLLLCSEYGRFA
jgi:hypothetical protein